MERLLEGIGDAFFVLRPKGKAIDDDLQGVIAGRRRLATSSARESFDREQTVKTRLAQDRCAPRPKPRTTAAMERSGRSAVPSANAVKLGVDRLRAIALDQTLAAAAVKHADLGKEQLKVIVQLGHRADGGARGAAPGRL